VVKVIEWCPVSVASRASQVESAIGLDQQQGNDYQAGLNLVFTVGTRFMCVPGEDSASLTLYQYKLCVSQLNWLWVSLLTPDCLVLVVLYVVSPVKIFWYSSSPVRPQS